MVNNIVRLDFIPRRGNDNDTSAKKLMKPVLKELRNVFQDHVDGTTTENGDFDLPWFHIGERTVVGQLCVAASRHGMLFSQEFPWKKKGSSRASHIRKGRIDLWLATWGWKDEVWVEAKYTDIHLVGSNAERVLVGGDLPESTVRRLRMTMDKALRDIGKHVYSYDSGNKLGLGVVIARPWYKNAGRIDHVKMREEIPEIACKVKCDLVAHYWLSEPRECWDTVNKTFTPGILVFCDEFSQSMPNELKLKRNRLSHARTSSFLASTQRNQPSKRH